MTRERPILFSAPMVRAILAGTKTQTRRVVQPPRGYRWLDLAVGTMVNDGGHKKHISDLRSPYGEPGDRLWVKESTIKVEDRGWIGPVYVESDAGRDALEWGYGESDDPDHIPPHAIKRRPSIFMTRAMSRITLEITGVRVERLQEISEGDAYDEGTAEWCAETQRNGNKWPNIVRAYRGLWEQINGRGSWAANPFVWVLEFRRLER
ncbi:MAG: hypothetical protein RJA36_2333 [Pseudomonadota bacterium]|jgi:hypothetical protein